MKIPKRTAKLKKILHGLRKLNKNYERCIKQMAAALAVLKKENKE